MLQPVIKLNPLESQILTGAATQLQRNAVLSVADVNNGHDRDERVRLRIARQCAADNVVRLNTRGWTTGDVQSGAGRVRVSRALKRLESLGLVDRLEMYLESNRTSYIRVLPAGLAAAESSLSAEHSA